MNGNDQYSSCISSVQFFMEAVKESAVQLILIEEISNLVNLKESRDEDSLE